MKFNEVKKDFVTVMSGKERPFFAENENERNISVPLFIEHKGFTDLERKKEEVAHWLKHEELKKLEFSDDPDRLYLAKVIEIDMTNTHRFGTDVLVKFECSYKYSQERRVSCTNEISVENIIGHKPTQWKTKTTFTANQTGYEIKFNAPGKTALRDVNIIKLNFNFKKGDVLQIDYSKREVLLNGKDITNTLVIIQSNFMELPIGQVEFTANHATEFYYHERYY